MNTPTVCFHAPWLSSNGEDELPPGCKPPLNTREHRFLRIPLGERMEGDEWISSMIHFYPTQDGWEHPEYFYSDGRTRPATQIYRPAASNEIGEALQCIDRSFFVDPHLINPETGHLTIVPWAYLTEEQRREVVSALEDASSA
ncbi:hypothetical protein [Azospirillum brasilense]|uniref:hypothetical protein n=1 Tax=Azospirillum brasilense TaxID=192 RepID=UPI001EDC543E|nr:hypothetical protein [Azospirillum brasilense]UKJ75451.1 hypothetical protein H1Q64_14455 [Azospirillum brasilense]